MIKTFGFALVHIAVAFSIVYAMTGGVLAGGLVALVEPACDTVTYHFHEKAWEFVRGSANRRSNVADTTRRVRRCKDKTAENLPAGSPARPESARCG